MNITARNRFATGLGLILLSGALVTPVVLGEPPAPGPCIGVQETGPHTLWWCVTPFQYVNPVRLTWTNGIFLQGSPITRPTLLGPLLTAGEVREYIYYDCDWNSYLGQTNHYYSASGTNIYYSSGFPTNATVVGTHTYTTYISVDTYPDCDPLPALSFSCTIVVQGNGDSDYDGISDYQEALNGTDPHDPASVTPMRLGYWPFDDTNSWAGSAGQLPLMATNVIGVSSWNTNAVLVDSTNAAVLKYWDVETNGNANINLRSGTLRFWFKPDWSGVSTCGTGPQDQGRLIEMGSQGTNTGWWTLMLDTNGNNLCFISQTNGYGATNLVAPINWTSNVWHQLVLTFNVTNSSLYVDGEAVVTNGLGMQYWPNATERSTGFRIGSDQNGSNQAKGIFDELDTFNYPLDAASILANYQVVWSLDSDGDGISNILENQMGLDPYSYNSPNGLIPSNGLQVFTPLK